MRWVPNLYHATIFQEALHCHSRMRKSIVMERNQPPLSLNYGLSLKICSINFSSTCTWNSLFVVFPPSSNSLWIRPCLANKVINIFFVRAFCKWNYWTLVIILFYTHTLAFCFNIILKHPRLFSSNSAIEKM